VLSLLAVTLVIFSAIFDAYLVSKPAFRSVT